MAGALSRVEHRYGPAALPGRATELAVNTHAFEILIGPYAVAYLRLSQQVIAAGGQLPPDGAHVYLTDTLESPFAAPPGQMTLLHQPPLAGTRPRPESEIRDPRACLHRQSAR